MSILRRVLFGTLTLMLLLTGSVLAHARFVKSEPPPDSVLSDPPAAVTIWFSEELDTRSSLIQVFDAAGVQVDLGNSRVDLNERKKMAVGLKQPLANGTYTVKWHSVSAEDQDQLDGEFKFTLSAATPVPATLTATPSPVPLTATPTGTPTQTPKPLPPTASARPRPAATPVPISPAPAGADFTLPLILLSVVVVAAGAFLLLRNR